MKKGKVFLVGAGPGDPGLITVKAKEYLAIADVVIYDYLANFDLLKYAKTDAELICGDKKGQVYANGSIINQNIINRLIVEKAKKGKTVVRLKGGDPFIFGRGGEEAEILVENKIPFEIVPGVTAASGLAYAGFPLTHRKYASSVSFITGHEDPNKKESSIDWDGIAKSGTSVFYMGVENLPKIVKRLIECKKSIKTPAALIERVTQPKQRVITGTLADIVQKSKKAKIKAPALIVIGEVINLREKLNWFEKKPLFGKKILVTRTREQASELSKLLEEQGAEAIEFPTIEVKPIKNNIQLDAMIKNLSNFNWIIFTSANGVQCFCQRLKEKNKDARIFKNSKIAAIGEATAKKLEEFNLKADLIPKNYLAEGLIESFKKINIEDKNILIARAKQARDILPQELKKQGAKITVLPIYETIIPKQNSKLIKEKLKRKEIDLITFTSSSTVNNFVEIIGKNNLGGLFNRIKIAAIGPITKHTLRSYNLSCHIMPQKHTIPALVEAIIRFYN